MAEEDLGLFDPTMMKKKKKKKKTLLLDDEEAPPAADDATAAAAAEAPAAEAGPAADEEDTGAAAEDLVPSFDGKKKKKKKKRDFDPDAVEAAAGDEGPAGAIDSIVDDKDFVLPPRKRKRKMNVEMSEEEAGVVFGIDAGTAQTTEARAWENSDRDYEYKELLERVFEIMRNKNPDMVAGEKRRFVMKPPQVVRIGTKKCAFTNFTEICKLLHRQADHLLGYILAELGTSGSMDSSAALVLKGRFQQKQMENVLRRYIREYVTCHTCKSPETILAKENRLYFLQCESCGSRCSVQSIKTGFQAVTGKRSKMRAKAAASGQ